MVTTALSVLPEEMEMEVLLRLPAKSILRFSAVCRRWAALLSSDEFRAAWTEIADQTTTEPADQLLFLPLALWSSRVCTEVRSGDGTPLLTIDGMCSSLFSVMSPAPCRGLNLLHDHLSMPESYHVLNATTRAVATLPVPPSGWEDNRAAPYPSTTGLGFDAQAKKHKVVRLFFGSDEFRYRRVKCELYTIGEGQDCRWRSPTSAADGSVVPSTLARAALLTAILHKLPPVFADGFLHWLVDPIINNPAAAGTSMPAAVLSFSVADETFGCWVRPPPFDWDDKSHLTELDGRLCIVRDLRRNSSLLEIWNYNSDGNRWSLQHRIDLASSQHLLGINDLTEPSYIGVVGKKKVIFIATSNGKVVTYDPISGTLGTTLQFVGETFSCQENRRSLARVSLFKASLTPVH